MDLLIFLIKLDLVLFDGWCNKICDRIKYLMSKKGGITDSINHNFGIIRTDSYNSLSIQKVLPFIML